MFGKPGADSLNSVGQKIEGRCRFENRRKSETCCSAFREPSQKRKQRRSGQKDHLRCRIRRRQGGDGLLEWTEHQALSGMLRLQEEKQPRLCGG